MLFFLTNNTTTKATIRFSYTINVKYSKHTINILQITYKLNLKSCEIRIV